ncbi:MAG: class I SAM-dependent methyltransferase family protein [Methanosarcinaceae archaeon]|nr:class I SAM-dependent methyltransferase family protein [Methanosarcinaceae archaeon]
MYSAIRIPPEKGAEIRAFLLEKGLFDRTRKIQKLKTEKGLFLEIPVKEAAGDKIGSFTVFEQENPVFSEKTKSLKEYLKDTLTKEELISGVPTGWQVLGDIVIVSIPAALESRKGLIAEALLTMYPKCKSVIRDFGIEGQFRRPKREVLAGTKTETVNKEHGCLFKVDVTKLMYSKGNLFEKKRMSGLGRGEVVVDMFAGIGYFSIPIAVHARPQKIYAIELNPESFAFLRDNIKLNHVENIIVPLNGDCAEVTPKGVADRVLMGYVGTTHHYLEAALRAFKQSGGILHYHETVPEKLAESRPAARIREAAEALGKKVEILECRRIKKYSPGVLHVVVDARIFE